MARRVVVTGLGLVTPVGVGVKYAWKNILEGYCGITSLRQREGFEQSPIKIAALVPEGSKDQGGFTPKEWLDRGVTIMESNEADVCSWHVRKTKGRKGHGDIYTIRHYSSTSGIGRCWMDSQFGRSKRANGMPWTARRSSFTFDSLCFPTIS